MPLRALVFVCLFALVPASAGAQNVDAQPLSERISAADARLDGKQAGISHRTVVRHALVNESASTNAIALAQSRSRQGQTLMIVGGVGFMAGLIIGDSAGTALAIGGAVIGLYGLYQWASSQ